MKPKIIKTASPMRLGTIHSTSVFPVSVVNSAEFGIVSLLPDRNTLGVPPARSKNRPGAFAFHDRIARLRLISASPEITTP